MHLRQEASSIICWTLVHKRIPNTKCRDFRGGRQGGGGGAVAVWGEEGEEEREKTTHNTQHALTKQTHKSNRQRPKSDDCL